MSYSWGGTALPLAAPATGEAATDKALTVVADYLQAFVNAYGSVAWAAVAKLGPDGTSPIRSVFTHNPEDPRREFNDKDLPALFLWRESGDDEWLAADWRVDTAVWKALWIFPPAKQDKQTVRDPFLGGLAKLVSFALKKGRDPAYQVTGDTDDFSVTTAAATTSLKTSIASAATAQSYSGAALNGAIGTGAIDPPRPPTVTTAGTLASLVPGSLVVFTGLNSLGVTITSTATLGAALGTFSGDYDLSSVASIAVDAQAGTAATLTFGTGARAGLGTLVLGRAGLVSLTMTNYRTRMLPIQPVVAGVEQGPALNYDALEFSFAAVEKLEEDVEDVDSVLSQFAALGGVDASFRREDDTEIETAEYDA